MPGVVHSRDGAFVGGGGTEVVMAASTRCIRTQSAKDIGADTSPEQGIGEASLSSELGRPSAPPRAWMWRRSDGGDEFVEVLTLLKAHAKVVGRSNTIFLALFSGPRAFVIGI